MRSSFLPSQWQHAVAGLWLCGCSQGGVPSGPADPLADLALVADAAGDAAAADLATSPALAAERLVDQSMLNADLSFSAVDVTQQNAPRRPRCRPD